MYALEVLNPKLVVAGKVDGIGAQQYIVGDNTSYVVGLNRPTTQQNQKIYGAIVQRQNDRLLIYV